MTKIETQETRSVRKTGRVCKTKSARVQRIALAFALIVVVGSFSLHQARSHALSAAFSRPDFDSSAQTGEPDVAEKYGYATLAVEEGYVVKVCGVPANDGQDVDFYLTNDSDNNVWLRGEVLDENDNVLGSSGIIKPGEYLTTITMDEPIQDDTAKVRLRVIAYEPETWQSRGNVSLQTTIYKNYQ